MKNLFKTLTFIAFFAISINVMAQQIVTGNVSDTNGLPLPGATVVIKGTSSGTTNDFDGNFSIETNSGEVLVVSYIGYITQELTVSDSATINVVLESDQLLDEVVITALGISREKKSLGYAVTEVSGENVNTVKDNNLASSLAGKVAGLQISQSGSLGSAARITIRGNNSLIGIPSTIISA